MSQIKEHDFVEIEYTGIVKEDDLIFDTTDEALAKKEGVYSQRTDYGPIVICVGEGHLIEGLDKRIVGLEPGEYEFDIPPQEAFGMNDPKLIQLVPASKFRKDNIRPMPGMQVQVDNQIGIVIRAGGGRVVVNFNHPLAAKEVHYRISIKGIVTDDVEKVRSIFKVEFGIRVPEIKKEGDSIIIDLKADVPEEIAANIKSRLVSLIGDHKIEFVKQPKKEKEVPEKKETEKDPEEQ